MSTAALIAKAAALILSDERGRKAVGWILVAVLSPLILLIAVICAFASGGAEHNNATVETCFYGVSYSAEVPAEFRSYVSEMQSAFFSLDSAVASVNNQMEDGSLDPVRVKAIFYALYFGADNLSTATANNVVGYFYTTETRTRTVQVEQEDETITEEEEEYTVAVPLSLESAYTNLAGLLGYAVTADQRSNADHIYTMISGVVGGDGSYLPQFLISFVGGVLADRYPRKKLIIGADTIIASVTLLMAAAIPDITTEPILLTGLLLMSVIRSLGAGIQTPAVNAVIPQLVPEDQLMRYNGINATMQSVVQFAAPAAAGAILTVSTLRSTLMIDIMTAVLGIGLLACVPLPKHGTAQEAVSLCSDMKLGVRYAFSHPLVGKLLVTYGLFIFLCVPAGFLAQLLVSRVYGDTYWYLTAVELVGFAGMIVGGILMSTWGGFKRRGKTLFFGLAAFGALAIGMGLSKNFMFYLTLMVFYGVALTMVQTAATTLIQEKAETSMQGRVFGLLGSMYSGFLPIGMAVFGPLADVLPLQWIMIGSGAALISMATVIRCDRSFAD